MKDSGSYDVERKGKIRLAQRRSDNEANSFSLTGVVVAIGFSGGACDKLVLRLSEAFCFLNCQQVNLESFHQ